MSKSKVWNEETFKEALNDKYGDSYEIVDKFKGYRTRLKVKHVCGHIFEVSPASFLNSPMSSNKKCPECRKRG